jgi:stage V sporulation protein SpoVS
LKEQAIALAKQQLAANGITLAQVDKIFAEQSSPNPLIQKIKDAAIAKALEALAENGITLAQVTNFNSLVMDQVDSILAE